MGRVIDDSKAVHLYYYRKSNKLKFGNNFCNTVPPRINDETKEGGPLPLATYLIDTERIEENHHIQWHNLLAPLEDGTGYYGFGDRWFWRKYRNRRCLFGLHPGTISLGCVTVVNSEWNAVDNFTNSGELTYLGNNNKIEHFNGYLTVLDE